MVNPHKDKMLPIATITNNKKSRDLTLLKFIIRTFKIVGICPCDSDCAISKIYVLIPQGTIICLSIAHGLQEIVLFQKNPHIFEKFLFSATICLLCIFAISIVCSYIKSKRNWTNLMQMVDKFDSSVSSFTVATNGKKWETIKCISIQICPFIYGCIEYFTWPSDTSVDIFRFISQYAGTFYEFQIAAFFWEISYVFETRYQSLQRHIKIVMERNVQTNTHLKNTFDNDILNIKYKYKILYSAIQELNVIFQWIILYLLFHIIVASLYDFYLMLEMVKDKNEILIGTCLFTVMISVSDLIVIMCVIKLLNTNWCTQLRSRGLFLNK